MGRTRKGEKQTYKQRGKQIPRRIAPRDDTREGRGKAEAKSERQSERQSGVEPPHSKEVAKAKFRLAFAVLRGESWVT